MEEAIQQIEDREIMQKIRKVVSSGKSAVVKQQKDGRLTVQEQSLKRV